VVANVATVLHILQHDLDLDRVHAPAAAEQYARRLAQRGISMAALLRAYRIGSTRFQHWCLRELAQQTDDPAILSAAGLRITETTAAYVDKISEELVAAYEAEREHWLRNLSAARAARVRALLNGDRVDSTPPRPSWATACGSTTSGSSAGLATPTRAAACSGAWRRRPWRSRSRQGARAGRSSCARTSPAPGPGCRSGRRAAHPAQEQRPVPGPQGRGSPRPSPRRAPPAGGAGPAGMPMARRHRPSGNRERPGRDGLHPLACQPILPEEPRPGSSPALTTRPRRSAASGPESEPRPHPWISRLRGWRVVAAGPSRPRGAPRGSPGRCRPCQTAGSAAGWRWDGPRPTRSSSGVAGR
jgi:hypothetical protein